MPKRQYHTVPPMAVALYEKGYSPNNIAYLFGVSTRVAAKALRRFGVNVVRKQMTPMEEHFRRGDGCWEWTGYKSNGYARWAINGKPIAVHRYMYEKANGPVPAGLMLDHLCRNRACVNPDHLEPVTNAVNSQRGAKAKMTPDLVRRMRAEFAAGGISKANLARSYGVTAVTVIKILRNEMWGNV